MSPPVILGIDPGMAALGWAVLELTAAGERVVDVGTLVTEKSAKKRGILVADDDVRRVRELVRALDGLVAAHRPLALCAELPAGSRGARAAQALGVGKALVAALAEQHQLPLAATSPQQLKKTVAGAMTATKEDVQAALERRYPGVQAMWPRRKADIEHAADALGAAVTCLDSDVIRMARHVGCTAEDAIEV